MVTVWHEDRATAFTFLCASVAELRIEVAMKCKACGRKVVLKVG